MDTKFFENLEAAKADANAQPSGEYQSMMQADIRRVRGQERQVELINEYRQFVKGAAAAIILTGEDQTSFAHKAEEEGGTLTIDAYVAYHDLLKGLWESMGGTGRFTLDQMVALHGRLDKYAKHRNIDIFRMPTFDRTMNTYHENKDAFIECIRKELVEKLGAFVVVSGVQQQIFTAAIAAKLVASPIPVVIVNAIEEEIKPLSVVFDNRVVVAEGTDEVVDVFKKLLNQLKTKEENNG
jgi:hypothetical protein